MKKLSFLGILLIVFMVAASTVASVTFERVYIRAGNDWASAVEQTPDGGYILVGVGSFDILLVKTDSLGEITWERTYDIGTDIATSVVQLPDGGYAIGAWSDTAGSMMNDMYFLRTDSLGNLVTQKSYGDPLADDIRCVLSETSDGGFMLAGSTDGDVYVVKLDSLGDSLWSKTYPTPDTSDYADIVLRHIPKSEKPSY
jgi:hypothetical protein